MGEGRAETFADYSQWEQWRGVKVEEAIAPGATGKAVASASAAACVRAGGKKKLSYLEAREFAGIEAAVEAAEERLQAARDTIEDPAVAMDAAKLTAALAEMEDGAGGGGRAVCAVGGVDGEGWVDLRTVSLGSITHRDELQDGAPAHWSARYVVAWAFAICCWNYEKFCWLGWLAGLCCDVLCCAAGSAAARGMLWCCMRRGCWMWRRGRLSRRVRCWWRATGLWRWVRSGPAGGGGGDRSGRRDADAGADRCACASVSASGGGGPADGARRACRSGR